MRSNDEILEYVSGLTVQEKKEGYASILHQFLVFVRANLIDGNKLTNVAHILHEMPPYLARDLEGWNDERFWNMANDFGAELEMIYVWFEMGVDSGRVIRDIMSRG